MVEIKFLGEEIWSLVSYLMLMTKFVPLIFVGGLYTVILAGGGEAALCENLPAIPPPDFSRKRVWRSAEGEGAETLHLDPPLYRGSGRRDDARFPLF